MRLISQRKEDRLKAAFLETPGVYLNEAEEKQLKFYMMIWAMKSNFHPKSYICKSLVAKEGITIQSAYRYYNQALEFFGDIDQVSKKAKQHFQEEMIMKGLKWAWENRKMKIYDSLLGKLIKVTGTDQIDKYAFTPDDLENNNWIEAIPKDLAQVLLNMLGTNGKINISEMMTTFSSEADAEEIDHQELDEPNPEDYE